MAHVDSEWKKWIPLAVSVFIVTIILVSIVRLGDFSILFFEDESTDDENGPKDYNDGKWFTIDGVTSTSFDIIVHDTPQGMTSLNCGPNEHIYNRLNPQGIVTELLYKPLPSEINLSTFDPENYDEDSLPHHARGSTIITGYQDVILSFNRMLHDSEISCALFEHGEDIPVIQRTLFQVPKVEGEHQPIVNMTMTKDWDGLTIHWESPDDMTWSHSKRIYLDESDFSTPTTIVDEFSEQHESVSSSSYIGGIAEGWWIIAVWGGAGDGYVEHVTWYEFEYTGKDCERHERCKTPVEMTPYATLSWPL